MPDDRIFDVLPGDLFVGEECALCGKQLKTGSLSLACPMHRECYLRSTMGGVNHQRGDCTCHGGTADPDPEHLDNREAAIAAFYYFLGRVEGDREL